MRMQKQRHGLILLVVLGMLSLISLLAVTFIVFSGNSRTASLQHARRDYRGTPPDRIFDAAIRQIVRGTNDKESVLWKQSLLEDLYGSADSLTVNPRTNRWNDSTPRVYPTGYIPRAAGPVTAGADDGPQLFPKPHTPATATVPQSFGPFLKIPLEWTNDLPTHHDAWVGRTLTFNSGPLAMESFRIVRYVGRIDDDSMPTLDAIQYSLVIDLSTVDHTKRTRNTSGVEWTLEQWLTADTSHTGSSLIYQTFPGQLSSPYSMTILGTAQNSDGVGFTRNGSVAPTATAGNNSLIPPFNSSYQPQLQPPFNTLIEALQPNLARVNAAAAYNGQTFSPTGDTDEPYDAADYNNFFLALRRYADVLTSDEIIPSFHRPDLINFIAGLDAGNMDISSLSPAVFLSFLELVERASGRPISYRIKGFPGVPNNVLLKNAFFSGSTNLDFTHALRNPQLQFTWGAAGAQEAFDAWLRWQLRGPWDVDNDGDGIKDSVWVDLNLPLSTSPDGKLLKVLAAIYIEDLDGKIDINAAGSQIQANSSTYPVGLNWTGSISPYAYNPNFPQIGDWPQGLGYHTADIYLRHLFDDDNHHRSVMELRYSDLPGADNTNDALSQIVARRNDQNLHSIRPSRPSYQRLPGFLMSTHGRVGIALDLLGNPMMTNQDNTTQFLEEEIDDPYEYRPLSGHPSDRSISLAEWERLARYNDADRSSKPQALEYGASTSWSVIKNANFQKRMHAISPRNVSLTTPRFNHSYQTPAGTRKVSSFVEFIESHCQRLPGFITPPQKPRISNDQLRELFPLEFTQNRAMDLNRPFGNGLDDNSNGEVDEPAELNVIEKESFPPVTGVSVDGDYVNGNYLPGSRKFDPTGELDPNYVVYSGSQSRQLFARHLYCLAQLILPDDYKFPNLPEDVTDELNKPINEALRRQTRARILAQWAVNVVDYRDADAAMTRFVYDEDPFYAPTGFGGVRQFDPSWSPDLVSPKVVFGMEQPELLLTEALATHDIRSLAHSNKQYQIRVPEGSLFLEFYCPRSTAGNQNIVTSDDRLAGLPSSLYGLDTNNNNRAFLDLARRAPAVSRPGLNFVSPVWRVALTEPDMDSNGKPHTDNFTEAFKGEPQTGPQDPTKFGTKSPYYSYQIGTSAAGLPWRYETGNQDPQPDGKDKLDEPSIDRVIWFTNDVECPVLANASSTLSIADPEKKVYNRRSGNARVEGGQYFVVGPRPMTYFGSRTQTIPRQNNSPSYHRISLEPDWVQIWGQDGNPEVWPSFRVPTNMPGAATPPPFQNLLRPCATMIAGANLPDAWTMTPPMPPAKYKDYIGLNISEPNADNYYEVPTIESISTDNAGDPSINAAGFKQLPIDGYVDLSSSPTGTIPVFDGGNGKPYFLENYGWPHVGSTPNATPEVKTQKNWSVAVLQRLADPLLPFHAVLNPYITVDWHSIDLTVFSGEDTPLSTADTHFATRSKNGKHTHRGYKPDPLGNSSMEFNSKAKGQTFFTYDTNEPPVTSDSTRQTTSYFKHELITDFYAGQAGPPVDRTAPSVPELCTLGYLNQDFVMRGFPNTSEYRHPYFLGSPSRVPDSVFWPNRNYVTSLDLANVPLSSPGTFNQDFYFEDPPSNLIPNPPAPRHKFTLDFEQDPSSNALTAAAQLLELVETPSPWMDSWTVLNPTVTSFKGAALLDELNRSYRPPFNLIPTYRVPGKINLNTATEPNVLQGLMGNLMTASNRLTLNVNTIPYRQELINSLSGGLTQKSVLDVRNAPPAGGNPYHNQASPTQFPGRFTSMQGRDAFPSGLGTNALSSTMFRKFGNQRLFKVQSVPAFMPANQMINNIHTFNHPASRLTNLVTDRSNVFAVRITLGYFEVDLDTGLGAEYGAEQGKATRNSAFYMIDRSIPVGFSPGVDGNSMNCVISRSIVQ